MFLREFLEDTPSLFYAFDEPVRFSAALDRALPDLIFANPALLSRALCQKLKVIRETRPTVRFFALESAPGEAVKSGLEFEGFFSGPPPALSEFQKSLSAKLPIPEKLRLLVVDDEEEIRRMLGDYFQNRVNPVFEVHFASDGAEGLGRLERETFDLAMLDIKMPVMDGREVFGSLRRSGNQTPVIIFFAAVFGDELAEIRKIGKAAVVEKGSGQSALGELLPLIKKMAFLG